MNAGVPPSKLKYITISDSVLVLWRKDETETLEGVKRVEIEQVTNTSKNKIKMMVPFV